MSAFLKCISPIDGSVYAERPLMDKAAAFAAVKHAEDAQAAWATRPLAARVEIVRDAVARIGEMNDDIVPELAWQMGRPVRYGGEFGGFTERASYMADIADTALAPIMIEDSDSFTRYIKRVPHGVVLVIAPWNYPYMTAINTVAPALIAGNAVMLKHASQTPLVGERLAQAFQAAGMPEDVFQNVFLGHDVTADLIAAKSFGFVNFTGSVGGGKHIETAAAGTFTNLGLELGGKDPGYVMEDADLEAAVTRGVMHMYNNTGQSCNAPSRMLVPRHLLSQAESIAAAVTESVVIGPTEEESTTMGPVISKIQWDKIQGLIQKGIDEGAKLVCGGTGLPDGIEAGHYVRPTVFSEANNDMTISREEIFGPVLTMIPYDSEEEAIRIANDTPYGLAGYVQSGDMDHARAVASKIRAGNIHINGASGGPDIPFGGYKQSGNGREWGAHGFTDYLEIKAIEGYTAA